MSIPPKAHVYKSGVTHCAECGHHIEASWHYVKGATHHALRHQIIETCATVAQCSACVDGPLGTIEGQIARAIRALKDA